MFPVDGDFRLWRRREQVPSKAVLLLLALALLPACKPSGPAGTTVLEFKNEASIPIEQISVQPEGRDAILIGPTRDGQMRLELDQMVFEGLIRIDVTFANGTHVTGMSGEVIGLGPGKATLHGVVIKVKKDGIATRFEATGQIAGQIEKGAEDK